MKKKRINLLQNRYDYYALERVFIWVRRTVIAYAIIFAIAATVAISYYYMKSKQADQLAQQRDLLLQSSGAQQSDEAKLLLLSKKLSYYKSFLKDDAQFVPYYNLLLEALKTSSQSGTLIEFNINKTREVTFTLQFNSFQEMSQAFAFIESDAFLHSFKSLSMSNFYGLSTDKTKYELTFKGVFEDIKNGENTP